MAIDFPTLLQGLGASAMAFADPRQSLLMSQGIFERNRLARERKERQEQQRRQLAVQEQAQALRIAQFQAEQQQAQQAAAQREAGIQRISAAMGGSMAPAQPVGMQQIGSAAVWTPPPMLSDAMQARAAIDDPTQRTPFPFNPQPTLQPGFLAGAGQTQGRYPGHVLLEAEMRTREYDLTGAAKVLSDYDERQAEIARKAAAPTAQQRNFDAWRRMSPEERAQFAAYREATGGGVNVDVNLAERAANNPYRAHPQYGEAKDGEAYDWVPPGEREGVETDAFGYRTVTDDQGTYPKMLSAKPGQPSAEEVKMRGLISAGYGSLSEMRKIADATDWSAITRGQYLLNIPGTEGNELRRRELDVYDAISKARTGAASNAQEQRTYRDIYGLSVLHSKGDVDRRFQHMEQSLRAYDDARKRLGIDSEKPLPADLRTKLDERSRNAPDINPYALTGLNFIGHADDGSGVIYELPSGRRVVRRYAQFE